MSSTYGNGPGETSLPVAEIGASAPAAPFASPAATPRQAAFAGFWRRVLAYILDGLLLAAAGIGVNMLIRATAGVSLTPIWTASSEATTLFTVTENVIGLVVGWIYFAVLESSSHQATLGKMALNLVVTDLTGHRIGFGRATGRYWAKLLSAIILLIGFAMAGFTRRKQALHDMVASTLVLKV